MVKGLTNAVARSALEGLSVSQDSLAAVVDEVRGISVKLNVSEAAEWQLAGDIRSRSGVSDGVVVWKAIVLAGGLDVVCLKDYPAAFLNVFAVGKREEGRE